MWAYAQIIERRSIEINEKTYDVVVMGGGPGGTPGANLLAKSGLRTALVEMGKGLGGTCLFEGCIPSKIYIETASRLESLARLGEFGIENHGSEGATVDFKKIRSRKDAILGKRVERAAGIAKMNGLDIFYGKASIAGKNTIEVDGENGKERLNFDKLIVATGSEPVIPPIKGAELCITSDGIFDLEERPESVVIIGGGYIGVEMASMLRRLGTRVSIVEMLPGVLSTEDPAVSEAVSKELERAGVEIHAHSRVTSIVENEDCLEVKYETDGTAGSVKGQKVLMAIGRKPRTSGLDLDILGIEKGRRGEIPVDEWMRTANENVYAPGDVNARLMLAHAATAQSMVAAYAVLGKKMPLDYGAIPHAIFSEPESSSVGMTSSEAAEKGLEIFRFPYSGDAKALIMGDETGFVQMIVDPKDHRLLGTQIVGKEASDLISEPTRVIKEKGRLEDITSTVHAHPTMSEIILEAAGMALGRIAQKKN